MNKLIIGLLSLIIVGCNEVDTNVQANLSGSIESKELSKKTSDLADSTFIPTYGNGIKHFKPQGSFISNYPLFQSLLQDFKYESLPYNLDAFTVDRTDEDWEKKQSLATKYFAFLLDESSFQAVANVTNPKENLTDFYQIYPIAKFGETEFFHSLLYVIRYLDGNGQQDVFYLSTFSNEGILLSSIEVGALEASAETYIKTAQIQSKNYIKVHHADYDEQIKDWVKSGESEYFLDNTGQIYANYENIEIQAGTTKKGSRSIEKILANTKLNDFSNYFTLFQKELRNNAPTRLLNYITFPHFRVSYEEHYQDFRSKEEFMSQYSIVFTEAFRSRIINEKIEDLIIKDDEIGLSDGSIWFKRIGRDNDGKLVVAIRVN